MMALVEHGISRQEAHEAIRVLSHEAGAVVKIEGKPNDLIERVQKAEFFRPIWEQLPTLLDPKVFTGRAAEQVTKFTQQEVDLALRRYAGSLKETSSGELHV